MFDVQDFLMVYKGKKTFVEESPYFSFFLKNLEENADLFKHIRFCNDILQLPPIYVFIKAHKETFNRPMTLNEKRGLGACFGYLFQNIWGYQKAVLTWVGEKTTNIKNASYFI
ncbi:MAG: hypothetical protein IJX31_01545 [Clostridia bacterium]|nr:hypothetical protein [Clostridia bacterium]